MAYIGKTPTSAPLTSSDITDAIISTAKIADDAVTFAKTDDTIAKARQIVATQTGAVATGTTTFPEDDTIPQNTEGDEYMTLGAGEFAFFPWASTVDLAVDAAQGSPVLEVRIYQESAA